MKIFRIILRWIGRILKWLGGSVLLLLVITILAGLIFRHFSPEPLQPKGELVDVGGFKLHINSSGVKSSKPTLVIEGGGGLSTEFYHWLNEDLKDSMRVVRYDRSGIGFSDKCTTPRDPETIAHELHTLLLKAGESPPYIMVGHSLGGPYIRVFTELYPKEVAAMFFLDATHPDHIERYNAPKQSSFKYMVYLWSLEAEAILAEVGVISLFDKLFGIPYFGEGLPEETNKGIKEFLRNGKLFRGYKEEMKYYYKALERSGEKEDFGALPIREFNAIGEHSEKSNSKLTPPKRAPKVGKHKEFADLSSNGKQIRIPGNHITIFTKKKNAEIIGDEIISLLTELER